MIEIGKTKIVPVRARGKDGKLHIQRGPDGQPETKTVSADVWRETRETLGGNYGKDKRRKLVVGLVGIDQLVLYPKGTRQEYRVNIKDIFAWAVRSRALRAQLERARERKDKLAQRRATKRLDSAERRLREKAKADQEWFEQRHHPDGQRI